MIGTKSIDSVQFWAVFHSKIQDAIQKEMLICIGCAPVAFQLWYFTYNLSFSSDIPDQCVDFGRKSLLSLSISLSLSFALFLRASHAHTAKTQRLRRPRGRVIRDRRRSAAQRVVRRRPSQCRSQHGGGRGPWAQCWKENVSEAEGTLQIRHKVSSSCMAVQTVG